MTEPNSVVTVAVPVALVALLLGAGLTALWFVMVEGVAGCRAGHVCWWGFGVVGNAVLSLFALLWAAGAFSGAFGEKRR